MAVFRSFIESAIPSNRFSFGDNTFAVEISDFNGSNFNMQRQIYDDACDVGIAIRSVATNNVVKFYLKDEHRDEEGDIEFWQFELCDDDMHKFKLPLLTVKIFND